MARTFIILAIAVAFLSPAWASNPGEPLDCSDWVFVESGFSCSNFARPCAEPLFCGGLFSVASDNEGRHYRIRETEIGLLCGTATFMHRWEFVRFDGAQSQVVAYIDERCLGGTTNPPDYDHIELHSSGLMFDKERGAMIVNARLESPLGRYESMNWLLSIEGFATTFEILQTYTPPSGPISFRVPYMPEGLQFADWFDTYYGTLATVSDWSQLQPLQCGYSASPPSVGDYLTVADPLPTPSPGHGYYYVTAVNFMGERRYGRKRTGGVLSGRDPAVLPACAE